MIVSATAPLPPNSLDGVPPAKAAAYNARKARVLQAVAVGLSRYQCAAPPVSFAALGLGYNFQQQVARAASLVSQIGQPLTAAQSGTASQSTGTSNAPTVVPLNPVYLTPAPPLVKSQGPFDTPEWGSYSGTWPAVCTPWASLIQALQNHPGWALGALAAVAVGAGLIGTGVKKRRARRARR